MRHEDGGAACGVCGAPAPAPYRPPAAETAPDLDLRPGEPARSTLSLWIAACGRCGAAADDLRALTLDDANVIAQAEYGAPPTVSAGAGFWRHGMIRAARGDAAGAFGGFLGAAWAADDVGDEAAARLARDRAVAVPGLATTGPDGLRLLDALRRAGRLPQARAVADGMAGDPVAAYQRARIAEGDVARHLMSSALRPPARTPHVLHGREGQRGFFARLFGR